MPLPPPHHPVTRFGSSLLHWNCFYLPLQWINNICLLRIMLHFGNRPSLIPESLPTTRLELPNRVGETELCSNPTLLCGLHGCCPSAQRAELPPSRQPRHYTKGYPSSAATKEASSRCWFSLPLPANSLLWSAFTLKFAGYFSSSCTLIVGMLDFVLFWVIFTPKLNLSIWTAVTLPPINLKTFTLLMFFKNFVCRVLLLLFKEL